MVLMAGLAALMIFSGVLSMLINLLKKKREKGSIILVTKGESDKNATVTVQSPGARGLPAE